MRTAQICPTCATYTNALCVIYDGPYLSNINVSPMDDLESALGNINDNLVPIYGAGAPTNSAIYEGQIYIDNVTSQVYIAIATGGGPADWEEVYTTANPPNPYKVYTAVISQSGTTAPTVDYLLQNTLSGTPTWGYNNVGQYTLTLPTQWVNNKTIVFINPGYIPQGFTIGWQRSSSSILIIDVRNSAGVYTDALLFKASIEVRVYN